MDPTVWIYYSKDGITWISSATEEEAQNKADLDPFSHIYFFAELIDVLPAG